METLSDTDSFPLIKTFFASAAAAMVLSVRQLRPHACVWPLQPATLAPLWVIGGVAGCSAACFSVTRWQHDAWEAVHLWCSALAQSRACASSCCSVILLSTRRHLRLLMWLSPLATNAQHRISKPAMLHRCVWPFAPVRVLCALHSGRKTHRSAVVLLTTFLSQPAAAITQGHGDQTSPS